MGARLSALRWALPGHVSACVSGDDVVFLDLAQGQYFCLGAIGEAFRLTDSGDTAIVCDAELAAELESAGLIVPRGALPLRARRRAQSPVRDIENLDCIDELYRPKPDEVGRVLVDAAKLYRGRGLKRLVDLVRRLPPLDPALSVGEERLAAQAYRFSRALSWVPFQGECLYRAFLMLLHLRRGGINADWVFGVRTWPFHAHCWLQHGDVVLGDTVDRLVAYAPIMVI